MSETKEQIERRVRSEVARDRVVMDVGGAIALIVLKLLLRQRKKRAAR